MPITHKEFETLGKGDTVLAHVPTSEFEKLVGTHRWKVEKRNVNSAICRVDDVDAMLEQELIGKYNISYHNIDRILIQVEHEEAVDEITTKEYYKRRSYGSKGGKERRERTKAKIQGYLAQGLTQAEIVEKLRLTPDVVRKYARSRQQVRHDAKIANTNKSLELHRQGMLNKRIAEVLGISEAAVSRYIRLARLTTSDHSLPLTVTELPDDIRIPQSEIVEQALAMHKQGMTGAAIGRKLGRSRSWAAGVIRRAKANAETEGAS